MTALVVALASFMAAPGWRHVAQSAELSCSPTTHSSSTKGLQTPHRQPLHAWLAEGGHSPVAITPRRGAASPIDDARFGPAALPCSADARIPLIARGLRRHGVDHARAIAPHPSVVIRGPPSAA